MTRDALRSPGVAVTVLVAARNEEANISRCISGLRPARRVIVVDSQSSDGTASLAEEAGAEVVQFHYGGGYPKKRQWALDTLDISTPWVLLVDADEFVTDSLWREIRNAVTSQRACAGYLIRKQFHFLGRRLRFGGFSHSAVLLFRTGAARFEELVADDVDGLDMEVHERLIVDGPVGRLSGEIVHDDDRGLEHYLDRHNRYSTWEARLRHDFLRSGSYGQRSIRAGLRGDAQARRRLLKKWAIRIPFEPALWFLYHYVFRLGFLEGRRGLIASQIRASYVAQARAKVFELSLDASDGSPGS